MTAEAAGVRLQALLARSGLLAGRPAARANRFLSIGIVLLGVALRARGFLFGGRPLWLDECAWAVFLFQGKDGGNTIRPIGFLAISKLLAVLFGASEVVLRTLPWLAGVATAVLAPWLGARLFRGSAARLLFVGIIALHPAAIDLSKEFKPYAVSLALHLALLFTTLRYVETPSARRLAWPLFLAFSGMFFAQDLVFAYPSVFLVLGWEAFRRERPHLRFIVLGAGLVIVGLGAHYFFVWSRISKSESTYWGDKYNVFYTAGSHESYLSWLNERFRGLRELPGLRRTHWQSQLASTDVLGGLRDADALIWSLVHFAGLVLLAVRKQWRTLVLVALPLFSMWVFNALHFWPLGAFRTNLFALAYVAAIAAAAFDGFGLERLERAASLPVLVLVLAPLFFFEDDWQASKRTFCYDGVFPELMTGLEELRRADHRPARETLFLTDKTCPQWEYYTDIHPDSRALRRAFNKYFRPRCSTYKQISADVHAAALEGGRVWAVMELNAQATAIVNDPAFKERVRIVERSMVGRSRTFAFELR